MESHTVGTSMQIFLTRRGSYCAHKHISWFLWPNRSSSFDCIHGFRYNVAPCLARKNFWRLCHLSQDYYGKCDISHASWRVLCSPVALEEEFWSLQTKNYSKGDKFASEASSKDAIGQPINNDQMKNYSKGDKFASEASSEDATGQPINNDQLKSLLADSERANLLKKLGEANQHNRYLKRQLRAKEDALVSFKSELAVTELEIQALVHMAKEIANYGIPEGSRKINGKYIQSHLLSRLEVIQEKLKEQIKDVELAQSKEVSLFWCGMAESVQVMGSFDGWSQGEHLSPEYNGSHTRFSTSVMLRPGRYEVKFLVDGEWLLSPEYPTVGEGLMKNNLLVVE